MVREKRVGYTGSWALNPASGEIYCSQDVLRIFGLENAFPPPVYEDFVQLIHPEDRERVKRVFEKAIQNRADFEIEYSAVREDGSRRHVHNMAHPVFDESGAIIEYVGTALDITERKGVEERLRESERRFRLLAESIPHHVWSFRADDSSVNYWNQRLIDYIDLAEEQLKTNGWEALHPDDVGRVKAAWQEALTSGEKYEVEQRIRGRDGSYRRFVCRAIAVKDAQGRPVEWFGTNTDVEERRRAEEALQKLQTELAHLSRVTIMGELVASIAHEINQPLAAIVNNTSACIRLAKMLTEVPEGLLEILQDITHNTNRAAAIISRIRMLTSRSEPQKVSLHIKDIIADVLVLLRRELNERRSSVHVELDNDLPSIYGDRVQIQQVLINIIMNGLDAMSEMDENRRLITIHGQRYTHHDNPMLLVSVQDFGCGFRKEDADRIFDGFYTTKPNGMGMGLRISHSIIEAHGGQLWAMSNEGVGSTFYFTLTLSE